MLPIRNAGREHSARPCGVWYAPRGSDAWIAATRDCDDVRIEVSDQGRGIALEDAERIF